MFQLVSNYKPTGDQPQAIKQLVEGINNNEKAQVLLGVTGSGKTFTMANVIEQVQKPILVLTHNKTLVAQLYGEFKQFFPNNAVEYFVSYYDYYQPESYIVASNTFIEKEIQINDEIEKLRLRTTASLMSGRRDVLVVASVSCIYGMGNPKDYTEKIIRIKVGQTISRNQFLFALVDNLYSRTTADFTRSTFRVQGDTVDIYLAYDDIGYRITFLGDTIEELETIDPKTGKSFNRMDDCTIFPANNYITPSNITDILFQIQEDMVKQMAYFNDQARMVEMKRIEERVVFDLEMIRELGYCSGIENYSRYFDHRQPGDRPYTLLDYFPKDFLLIIDESHVSIPQLRAMYGGDRSRKTNLVEYGFRLPSALDNRPLKFEETESIINQVVYVSATPADYELQQTDGVVVQQVIRPTGLLDPPIQVRPIATQVDDLLNEVAIRVEKKERILVTTLTKRMAEELSKYMANLGVNCRYIHSDVDTLDRVEILRDLRLGTIDVVIGVNLLREGLDLPEVTLVAILDADKEGFLRSERSLTQTAGRAARNSEGLVIMYADKITNSMQKTIDETNRRRRIQTDYNLKHNITPTTVHKTVEEIMKQTSVLEIRKDKTPKHDEFDNTNTYKQKHKDKNQEQADLKPNGKPIANAIFQKNDQNLSVAAEQTIQYMSQDEVKKLISFTKKQMEKSAKELDFIEAARMRDELYALEKMIKK